MNKASIYSRFIPDEEVDEVANWRFDAFTPTDVAHAGDPQKRRSGMQDFDAQTQPSRPATPPQDLPGYDAGFEAGRTTGYDAGLRDGLAQLELYRQQQGQAQAQRIDSVARQFSAQLQGVEQHIADAVVAIALDVARQVVRTQVQADPQAVLPVAREAVQSVVQPSGHLTLRLHPTDLDVVREHLDKLADGRSVLLQADAGITPGGCLLETAAGAVDGRLERRWARAVAALGRADVTLEPDA